MVEAQCAAELSKQLAELLVRHQHAEQTLASAADLLGQARDTLECADLDDLLMRLAELQLQDSTSSCASCLAKAISCVDRAAQQCLGGGAATNSKAAIEAHSAWRLGCAALRSDVAALTAVHQSLSEVFRSSPGTCAEVKEAAQRLSMLLEQLSCDLNTTCPRISSSFEGLLAELQAARGSAGSAHRHTAAGAIIVRPTSPKPPSRLGRNTPSTPTSPALSPRQPAEASTAAADAAAAAAASPSAAAPELPVEVSAADTCETMRRWSNPVFRMSGAGAAAEAGMPPLADTAAADAEASCGPVFSATDNPTFLAEEEEASSSSRRTDAAACSSSSSRRQQDAAGAVSVCAQAQDSAEEEELLSPHSTAQPPVLASRLCPCELQSHSQFDCSFFPAQAAAPTSAAAAAADVPVASVAGVSPVAQDDAGCSSKGDLKAALTPLPAKTPQQQQQQPVVACYSVCAAQPEPLPGVAWPLAAAGDVDSLTRQAPTKGATLKHMQDSYSGDSSVSTPLQRLVLSLQQASAVLAPDALAAFAAACGRGCLGAPELAAIRAAACAGMADARRVQDMLQELVCQTQPEAGSGAAAAKSGPLRHTSGGGWTIPACHDVTTPFSLSSSCHTSDGGAAAAAAVDVHAATTTAADAIAAAVTQQQQPEPCDRLPSLDLLGAAASCTDSLGLLLDDSLVFAGGNNTEEACGQAVCANAAAGSDAPAAATAAAATAAGDSCSSAVQPHAAPGLTADMAAAAYTHSQQELSRLSSGFPVQPADSPRAVSVSCMPPFLAQHMRKAMKGLKKQLTHPHHHHAGRPTQDFAAGADSIAGAAGGGDGDGGDDELPSLGSADSALQQQAMLVWYLREQLALAEQQLQQQQQQQHGPALQLSPRRARPATVDELMLPPARSSSPGGWRRKTCDSVPVKAKGRALSAADAAASAGSGGLGIASVQHALQAFLQVTSRPGSPVVGHVTDDGRITIEAAAAAAAASSSVPEEAVQPEQHQQQQQRRDEESPQEAASAANAPEGAEQMRQLLAAAEARHAETQALQPHLAAISHVQQQQEQGQETDAGQVAAEPETDAASSSTAQQRLQTELQQAHSEVQRLIGLVAMHEAVIMRLQQLHEEECSAAAAECQPPAAADGDAAAVPADSASARDEVGCPTAAAACQQHSDSSAQVIEQLAGQVTRLLAEQAAAEALRVQLDAARDSNAALLAEVKALSAALAQLRLQQQEREEQESEQQQHKQQQQPSPDEDQPSELLLQQQVLQHAVGEAAAARAQLAGLQAELQCAHATNVALHTQLQAMADTLAEVEAAACKPEVLQWPPSDSLKQPQPQQQHQEQPHNSASATQHRWASCSSISAAAIPDRQQQPAQADTATAAACLGSCSHLAGDGSAAGSAGRPSSAGHEASLLSWGSSEGRTTPVLLTSAGGESSSQAAASAASAAASTAAGSAQGSSAQTVTTQQEVLAGASSWAGDGGGLWGTADGTVSAGSMVAAQHAAAACVHTAGGCGQSEAVELPPSAETSESLSRLLAQEVEGAGPAAAAAAAAAAAPVAAASSELSVASGVAAGQAAAAAPSAQQIQLPAAVAAGLLEAARIAAARAASAESQQQLLAQELQLLTQEVELQHELQDLQLQELAVLKQRLAGAESEAARATSGLTASQQQLQQLQARLRRQQQQHELQAKLQEVQQQQQQTQQGGSPVGAQKAGYAAAAAAAAAALSAPAAATPAPGRKAAAAAGSSRAHVSWKVSAVCDADDEVATSHFAVAGSPTASAASKQGPAGGVPLPQPEPTRPSSSCSSSQKARSPAGPRKAASQGCQEQHQVDNTNPQQDTVVYAHAEEVRRLGRELVTKERCIASLQTTQRLLQQQLQQLARCAADAGLQVTPQHLLHIADDASSPEPAPRHQTGSRRPAAQAAARSRQGSACVPA